MNTEKQIIAFEDPKYGVIYFEVETNEEEELWENVSNDSDDEETVKIKDSLSSLLSSIKTFGSGVLDTVTEIGVIPDEVEVKAGLKLAVSEGKLIALFAKAKAEFPFEVTLKWKNPKKQAKTPTEETPD